MAGLMVPVRASGQGAACAAAVAPVPAAMAYAKGDFGDAEVLYQQALVQAPKDAEMTAGLARARLRQGKVAEAAATVADGLASVGMAAATVADGPASVGVAEASAPKTAGVDGRGLAALLTARAEVELREGLPWRARTTLDAAAEADPCYARVALVRSRIDRLDSMYATERREVQAAYALDAKDPEIKRAWNQTVMPANDINGAEEYLASEKTVDPELRKAAEASVHAMLPLLSETSQTCQGVPTMEAAVTLPLVPSMQDGKHVDGYRLEVQFGQTKAMLGVDTAASGLYVSRALAEANGLVARAGDPAGTVHAEAVQVGPLRFHDCVVGVSEAAFPGKAAGFVGTDLFASSLVTLNFPEAKLSLEPLPAVKGYVPGDRLTGEAALRGYSPVYHRLQYLMVPVTVNGKERRLFVLDSGIRLSTMTLPVAHLVSSTQRNFTNPMKTTTGATFQVYRDAFDFEFAELRLPSRTGLLQFDPAVIEQHAQMAIGGMLGFDMLHTAVLHLDYRDGLIKVEFPDGEAVPAGGATRIAKGGVPANADDACEHGAATDVPAAAAIELKTTGLWDTGRMKAGQAVTAKVVHSWAAPACQLDAGALVYGHVMAATVPKGQGEAQLAVAFDRADCFGQEKKALPLKVVSVVAAPGEFIGMQTAIPVASSGGMGRHIGDAVAAQDLGDDQNLSPERTPSVIRAGSVRGIPTLTLQPDSGPACSALLTKADRSLRLGPDTKFLVVMQDVVRP